MASTLLTRTLFARCPGALSSSLATARQASIVGVARRGLTTYYTPGVYRINSRKGDETSL